MVECKAGIYAITHKPTGAHYIGQANHVDARWREHKRQLRAGTHHNPRLQKLWSTCDENDFDFWLLAAAPVGLPALTMQRWLVREERSYLQLYRERSTVLNEAEPEIVPTREAVREYQREQRVRDREHDERIRTQRREIKSEIRRLKELVRPLEERLWQLGGEYRERQQLLKSCTGLRRLFHSPPPGFDTDAERRQQAVIEHEYQQLAPEVRRWQNEIEKLSAEYRHLYRQFTKVSERRWSTICRYALGRSLGSPTITE